MSVSQIQLVAGILSTLERLGARDMNERQMNSVIEAATDMCRELSEENRPAKAGMDTKQWLDSDDTGMSSRYMASVLCDDQRLCFGRRTDIDNSPAIPHDPIDFGRCVRLLESVPDLRSKMHRLTQGHGLIWKMLAEDWDRLESLYREELPSGRAPRLYDELQKIQGSA